MLHSPKGCNICDAGRIMATLRKDLVFTKNNQTIPQSHTHILQTTGADQNYMYIIILPIYGIANHP